MATVTLRRSDIFPVGTTVGIYPRQSRRHEAAPTSAVIQSAAVDAAGLLTVTDAGIVPYTAYVAYAAVSGEHRYAQVRSTLDVQDTGTAVGTGTTASGSPVIANLVASSGAFAQGQRISTATALAAIPAGTVIAGLSTVAAGAVTGVAATNLFTRSAHGLKVGDPVIFTGLTGGAGITASAVYYVTSVPDANTFKVSGSRGGTELDFTTDLSSGTVTGVCVLSQNAGASGAQNLVAEGARVPAVELGATPVPRGGTWQARVAQRRQLAGTS